MKKPIIQCKEKKTFFSSRIYNTYCPLFREEFFLAHKSFPWHSPCLNFEQARDTLLSSPSSSMSWSIIVFNHHKTLWEYRGPKLWAITKKQMSKLCRFLACKTIFVESVIPFPIICSRLTDWDRWSRQPQWLPHTFLGGQNLINLYNMMKMMTMLTMLTMLTMITMITTMMMKMVVVTNKVACYATNTGEDVVINCDDTLRW